MQTFVPYPEFDRSVEVLDSPRLGKQRVEALQLLRALLLPSYGWQRHPVVAMWRGYLPGLTKYALTAVDAWTARGHADSTRPLIREFAPFVDALTQQQLAEQGLLPPWIGNEAMHRSHRSNLLQKNPHFYGPLFPGDPADLPYLWPGEDPTADAAPSQALAMPPHSPDAGTEIWVVRAESAAELERWRIDGVVALGELSPRGRDTPAWRAQLDGFARIAVGEPVGVLVGNDPLLQLGMITGELRAGTEVGETAPGDPSTALSATVERDAEYGGSIPRQRLAVPATLQNPRSVFRVRVPDDAFGT